MHRQNSTYTSELVRAHTQTTGLRRHYLIYAYCDIFRGTRVRDSEQTRKKKRNSQWKAIGLRARKSLLVRFFVRAFLSMRWFRRRNGIVPNRELKLYVRSHHPALFVSSPYHFVLLFKWLASRAVG